MNYQHKSNKIIGEAYSKLFEGESKAKFENDKIIIRDINNGDDFLKYAKGTKWLTDAELEHEMQNHVFYNFSKYRNVFYVELKADGTKYIIFKPNVQISPDYGDKLKYGIHDANGKEISLDNMNAILSANNVPGTLKYDMPMEYPDMKPPKHMAQPGKIVISTPTGDKDITSKSDQLKHKADIKNIKHLDPLLKDLGIQK